MSLSEIVAVTITAETRFPTQRGFGTPLIAGYHTAWVGNRVQEFSDLTELVTAGIPATHPIYRCASKILSQNPRPATFKVGRRDLAMTQTVRLTPVSTAVGLVYSIKITTPLNVVATANYTVQSGDTVALIIDGLKIAIDALALALTVTDNTTSMDVAATTPGQLFDYVVNRPSEMKIKDTTTNPGIATDLAAIETDDPDWYALCLDSNSEAEGLAAAAWVESTLHVLALSSYDEEITDAGVSNDFFSDLKTAGYKRTLPIWSIGVLSYAGAAWLGEGLPFIPGSQTWAFKELGGVTVATDAELTTARRTQIITKRGNYYFQRAGSNRTFNGQTPSGQFFDITNLIDLLTARIMERVAGLLFNNRKVPYTDAGVDMIRSEILGVLQESVESGALAADPAPVVTAPLVADVADADKAARLLPDVLFTATLAGAVHKVIVAGKLVL